MNREIDSLSLLGDDLCDSDGSVNYSLIIDAPSTMYLYGFIALESRKFAMAKMAARIGSVVFTILSYYTTEGEHTSIQKLIIIYVGYFIMVTWVIVPLYQNYSIRVRKTKEPLKFNQGFVCCRACYVFGSLCLCACDQSPYEIVDRATDRNSNHNTRFMPFSLYNYWFMIFNPGKMLNPELPEGMTRFGFGRGFCYIMCTSALGNLNFYILMNAVAKLVETRVIQGNVVTLPNGVSFAFAMISALCSLTSIRVTLMSVLQGILFFPFVFGMYCGIFFFDICDVNNPKRGTWLYNIYCKFWMYAASCQ